MGEQFRIAETRDFIKHPVSEKAVSILGQFSITRPMNNILYIISGAAGHLAGVILRALINTDCLIRGLLLPEENGIAGDNVTYITGDVTKPETLDQLFENTNGVKVIVLHCAGIVSIQKKVLSSVYRVNATGTRNIITKCRQYGVHRLVYVSSVHALPETKGMVIREVNRFSPDAVNGDYAKTKAEATQAVLDASKSGLNAVIVHPSGIVGPFDRHMSNHIVQMISLYLSITFLQVCEEDMILWMYGMWDVAKGILLAAEKGKQSECYILSNRYISMKEIFEEMRMCMGRKHRLPLIPYFVARLFAPVCEWYAKTAHTRSIYAAYSIKTLSGKAYFSHDKTETELGYHTRNFRETVENTLTYLQQNMGE